MLSKALNKMLGIMTFQGSPRRSRQYGKLSSVSIGLLLMLLCSSCSKKEVYQRQLEEYRPVTRREAPEPVYGRVTWAHLPKPVAPKALSNAPYLLPVVSFDLVDSNLEEAIEALAQTMGYDRHYPKSVAKRKVSIKMVGTVEEVLTEIASQAKVTARFEHERKLVRVFEDRMLPQLPGSK